MNINTPLAAREEQIRRYAADGLTDVEAAERAGLKVSTIHAYADKWHIPIKRTVAIVPREEVIIGGTLRNDIAREASRRGVHMQTLTRKLLRIIVDDNLFAAILDR